MYSVLIIRREILTNFIYYRLEMIITPAPELAVAIAKELLLEDPQIMVAKAILNGSPSYRPNTQDSEKTSEEEVRVHGGK